MRRNSRLSKQPFILEESPIDTMANQRTMAELLRAPTEGYAEANVVPPILAEQFDLKHSLINMMILDQFFGLEKDNPHDHIWAAHRWLEKGPLSSIHTWEDLVSKFINEFFPPREQQISVMKSLIFNNGLMNRFMRHGIDIKISFMLALIMVLLTYVKAVEENCVTCGGAHPYYQCLAAGGNTFPELRDNIQGYVLAAAVNYNQAPTQQNQNFPLNELEKVKRMDEANMKAMQTQINIVKNKLRNEKKNSIQASLSNQTNEIKNMIASLFQMNTTSTSGSGSLPSNIVANPKGKLKAITTRSGFILDGPIVPTPTPFINPEVDERVEETLTDLDLCEYTIKVPPPPVQKYKPPSQRDYIVHQTDPLHPNIPYPSRMLKQKQQEKDEYQKMLKALLSNKEKLQELANTPLNENCLAVILKKLPEKLRDPGKFLISYGFSELKYKALADLGASINLMPLSVRKKLGLPELIFNRMTLELANRAICTPAGIARDVFVPVGKFTFPADFVIVDYESDPRVPLILGRHFLWTARALINVHGEEMILRDDFLEDLFSTNQPSGNPIFSSHPELTSPKVKDDIVDPEGGNVLPEKLLDLDSTEDLHPPLNVNPLSGSTTYSFSLLLEEFVDELALITFPSKYDDDLQFDNKSDLKEIEFLLHQEMDSSLKDSIDQSNLANNFVDSITEMFTDEHVLDYSSPPIFDEYDDDFLEVESDTKNVYDDPFDPEGVKIKESKLLIDELDLLCDFILPFEYDLFLSEDFSRVDALPPTNNEDKIFNSGILI
uniref:Reverse transcriptase domain-containing protein n=1 Tax=Tanacetum cinerariifolium TaxID=118510 RepID=A0A6L2LPC3_TANCI|nr:hypothetical protein [Tanacetum cinerariifolium]